MTKVAKIIILVASNEWPCELFDSRNWRYVNIKVASLLDSSRKICVRSQLRFRQVSKCHRRSCFLTHQSYMTTYALYSSKSELHHRKPRNHFNGHLSQWFSSLPSASFFSRSSQHPTLCRVLAQNPHVSGRISHPSNCFWLQLHVSEIVGTFQLGP